MTARVRALHHRLRNREHLAQQPVRPDGAGRRPHPVPLLADLAPDRMPHPAADLRLRTRHQQRPRSTGPIARAKATCRRRPIAAACLQWALVHPELTPEGIWAATTASERTGLRHRLIARLGKDWVVVVADRRRVEGAMH
ncbi:WhiB family transcriptional regulator [Streptomyces sp. NPDC001292]|uniref:WhiB family transcriptional regulator n=1 Tax=Streptomyces sp. NPDC001292 TaxID=3364558 RepID=UPI0036C0834E